MSRRVVLLLAITCGVAVGNIYFLQAVSPPVAAGLGVPPGSAVLVATAAQVGYAVGIFLLVPLGDRIPHRPLVVALLVLTGLGPMAVGLVDADRRGAVSGALLSGSIGGMLLSRAFGGALGEWLGWRVPYLAAGALALLVAAVLASALPKTSPPSRQRYPALLAEPLRLLLEEPELRRSCFYQAAVFAGFSAVWTTVALLLTGPTYGLGGGAVGLLALVGAGTMLCAPLAGRLVDRRGPDPVNLACMIGVLASAGVLLVGGLGGTAGLVALVSGALMLDVAMQSGMVANQVRIYALGQEVLSRLNTAYMTCAFLGGGLGSWLGTLAYAHLGWPGVCALVAALCALALVRHRFHLRRAASRAGLGDAG